MALLALVVGRVALVALVVGRVALVALVVGRVALLALVAGQVALVVDGRKSPLARTKEGQWVFNALAAIVIL